MINLARETRATRDPGLELGLAEDELGFYDALEVNDSAVAVLGDETLKSLARKLVELVKEEISIDRELHEDA